MSGVHVRGPLVWGWAITLLALCAGAVEHPVRCADPVPDAKPERVDQFGDPLPEGVAARLGTVRLRRAANCAFAPDGKTIVTHKYNELRVWDVATGKERKRIESKGECFGLAVSPDGERVATSKEGGIVIDVVDLTTDKSVYHLRTREELSFNAPKTHSLVFSGDGKKLFTSDDRDGYVWDMTTGKQVSSFPHPSGDKKPSVWVVMFSADGKLLATESEHRESVRVWDVATGKQLQTFKIGSWVDCCAFSPKADLLAVGDADSVQVWDVATGKKAKTLKGQKDQITSLAFSPDGSLLAATGWQKIHLWNVAAGEIVTTVPALDVGRVVFSPDGKILAWESGGSICLLAAATTKNFHAFAAHSGPVASVAYSPSGERIATGSHDGDVRLWNPTTGAAVGVLNGHKDRVLAVAFFPDGKLLVSGSRDGQVIIWDVATQKLKRLLKGAGSGVKSVVFSPDCKSVATAGYNYQTVIWSTETGKPLLTLEEDGAVPQAITFFPNGKYLATSAGKSVRVWDLKTGKVDKVFPLDDVETSLAVSPDGKYLAGDDYVWDLGTGKRVATLPGNGNNIGGLAFSPDGAYLAFASDGLHHGKDHNVHIWETKTWKEVEFFRAPLQRYQCLAFAPDGKRLAIGSVHAEVLIWDLTKK